jgi:hypothetical protein
MPSSLSPDVMTLADSISQEFANPQPGRFEYYAKPAVPLVFRPFPNGRSAVHYYAVSPGQPTVFHFEPVASERRPDVSFIGSFLHVRAPVGAQPFAVQLDETEVPSRRFGEKGDGFYFLGGGNESAARQMKISIRPDAARGDIAPRSWFVVQAVERKPIPEVLRELCDRGGYTLPTEIPPSLEAHTSQCRACNFNGITMIERAQAFGETYCPTCGKLASLTDLVWSELLPRGADDEEPPDVRAAKAKFFEHYAAAVCWPMLETDWAEIIFGEAAEPEYTPEELHYENTEQFLAEMERLRPQPSKTGGW